MLVDPLPILLLTSFPSVLHFLVYPFIILKAILPEAYFTKLITILNRSTFERDGLSDWISGNLTQVFQNEDFRSDNRTHAINL